MYLRKRTCIAAKSQTPLVHKCIFFALIFSPNLAGAQDHQWWADNVGWDGQTHWSTYIRSMPRYMGPNALPVPELTIGKVPERSFLSFDAQAHISRGDHTFNPVLRGVYAVAPGKVSLEAWWVPVEYAVVSHEVQTERRVFHRFYNNRWATGDVYVQTYLQLLNQSKSGLDALLRMGHRLPSSNMQGAARFTDAPGYFADVSLGKSLHPHWRIFGMAGLHVWQTNLPEQFQNDAFVFGIGAAWDTALWYLDIGFRGYLGYMGRGDDPLAVSISLERRFANLGWRLGLQQGFQDLRYTTLQAGLRYYLPEQDR